MITINDNKDFSVVTATYSEEYEETRTKQICN